MMLGRFDTAICSLAVVKTERGDKCVVHSLNFNFYVIAWKMSQIYFFFLLSLGLGLNERVSIIFLKSMGERIKHFWHLFVMISGLRL